MITFYTHLHCRTLDCNRFYTVVVFSLLCKKRVTYKQHKVSEYIFHQCPKHFNLLLENMSKYQLMCVFSVDFAQM